MGVLIPVLATWAQSAAAYMASYAGFTYASVTAFAVAAAAIEIGTFAILGSALSSLMPDMRVDNYAGAKLQTTKDNTSAVPVIYGKNKLSGNIIWQTTNNYNGGTTNNDYWAIIVIGQGEINDFLNVYRNEDELTKSGNYFTSDYTQVRAYTTSGDGINITDLEFITDSSGTVDTGGNIFGQVTLSGTASTDSIDNLTDGSLVTSWSPTDWTDEYIKITPPADTLPSSVRVYINNDTSKYTYSFKLQYSDDDSTWVDASSVVVNSGSYGQSWYDIPITETATHPYWRVFFDTIKYAPNETVTEGAEVYELDFISEASLNLSVPNDVAFVTIHELYDATNNPQLTTFSAIVEGKKIYDQVADTYTYSNNPAPILKDVMFYNLGISLADMDTDSLYDLYDYCIANNITCNIVFNQQQQISTALQQILSTFRGFLTYSNGKWVVLWDKQQASITTLTEDDIISNSLSISMKGNSDIANKITVKYVNPDDAWQSASVSFWDDDLIALDGQENEQIVDIIGCTSKSQALLFAELTLNQMRYSEDADGNRINQTPFTVSFTTSIKNAEIEVGDVITLDVDMFEFQRDFRVISVNTDQSGALKIQANLTVPTHYKDRNGNNLIV